jgi:hypothetical protein
MGVRKGRFAVWRKPGTRLLVDDPVEEAALDLGNRLTRLLLC